MESLKFHPEEGEHISDDATTAPPTKSQASPTFTRDQMLKDSYDLLSSKS
jgi:hypothetical protein